MTLPRKWKYWPDWDGWHISNKDDQNIVIEKVSGDVLTQITASLSFTDDMPLSPLEAAPDTAKNLFREAWALLNNYLIEIEYQLEEVDHDADAMALWEGDRERVMAYMKKIEPLTDISWFIKEATDAN